jgi:hypothetical protein
VSGCSVDVAALGGRSIDVAAKFDANKIEEEQ